MSEIVERVARAITKEHYGNDDDWRLWRGIARAAIETMKEPTGLMIKAGLEGWKANNFESIQWVWPCMVDAALTSDEPPAD